MQNSIKIYHAVQELWAFSLKDLILTSLYVHVDINYILMFYQMLEKMATTYIMYTLPEIGLSHWGE